VIIIRQIRIRNAHREITALNTNLNLSFVVRLIDNRNSQRAIRVLKCGNLEVLSRTDSIDTNGSRTCEAEVAGKRPETAGYFEGVTSKTYEDGVAAGGVSGVVLCAPPVEVAGCVAVYEGLVPFCGVSSVCQKGMQCL